MSKQTKTKQLSPLAAARAELAAVKELFRQARESNEFLDRRLQREVKSNEKLLEELLHLGALNRQLGVDCEEARKAIARFQHRDRVVASGLAIERAELLARVATLERRGFAIDQDIRQPAATYTPAPLNDAA